MYRLWSCPRVPFGCGSRGGCLPGRPYRVPEPDCAVVSAEASRSRPSARVPKATEVTLAPWLRGSTVCVPVSGSQSRTVPSSPPEASRSRPSARVPKATEKTVSPWPVRVSRLSSRRRRAMRVR